MTFAPIRDRARRFRWQLAGIAALGCLSALATLAVPWLAGTLLAGAIEPAALDAVPVALVLLAILLLLTLLAIGSAFLTARTGGHILADLRRDVYRHIQRLPLDFHDGHRQGELLALMTYEVGNLSDFLTGTLARVPAMLLLAAGSVVMLFAIDPGLAIGVPLLVPLFYIVLRLAARRLRGIGAAARDADADLFAMAESHLEMLPATKAFAVEEAQARAYTTAIERARLRWLARDRASAVIGPVMGLVAALAAVALLLAIADGEGGSGTRDAAGLFAFLLYAALLTRPVAVLAEVYGSAQIARGTLERLHQVLEVHPESTGDSLPSTTSSAERIVFDDVAFAYRGRPPLFTGLDLTIEPGEVVAFTGENGAGKSTLIKLLLRLYEVGGGRILLGDTDIAAIDVQALRRRVGYVPQRALLFDGTVRENILFGAPEAGAERLERAMRQAQASEFVALLPDGLDTRIGDHGVRLSGGQRQRLALARALVADPPILVFDEATSMYDQGGEAAFVEASREALKGRTVLVITHRPASLSLADRVIRIEDGVAVEAT